MATPGVRLGTNVPKQLNGKEVVPIGEQGTGAGVRHRRHLAESKVGVGVLKNIRNDEIIKRVGNDY